LRSTWKRERGRAERHSARERRSTGHRLEAAGGLPTYATAQGKKRQGAPRRHRPEHGPQPLPALPCHVNLPQHLCRAAGAALYSTRAAQHGPNGENYHPAVEDVEQAAEQIAPLALPLCFLPGDNGMATESVVLLARKCRAAKVNPGQPGRELPEGVLVKGSLCME